MRLCVSRYRAGGIQVDFTEGPTKSMGPKRSVQFSYGTSRHMKIRERKGPSQGVFQHTGPHERSLNAPKFEGRFEEETLKQERCARRVARKMTKSIHTFEEKDKGHIFLSSNVCCLPAPSFTETKGKRLCGTFRSFDAHAEQE